MKTTRRDFLIGSGCLGLSAAAYGASLSKLSLMNLFATANANGPVDPYKALVCVFLFGGNDANNLLIPYDDFDSYRIVRQNAPFFINQGDLAQISAGPSHGGAMFGLPNRTTYDTTKIQSLYNANKLAFVCNVGTLVQPITTDEYRAGAPRPTQLFSHSDQQNQNQTARVISGNPNGWGGLVADRVRTVGDLFPLQVSVSGVTIFTAGNVEHPLVVTPTGPLDQALKVDVLSQHPELTDTVTNILALDNGVRIQNGANRITRQALDTRERLSRDPMLDTTFPPGQLGSQLQQIAKFIKLRGELTPGGMKKQVFFASRGGFDTHANQNAGQGALLTELSFALDAFQREMEAQGVGDKVTTFTLSDFARTFKIGAQASGTDHAWGSHALVMGGAVRGGNFYGRYPDLTIAGTNDVDNNSTARGRWLPTTGLAQYTATIAKWFGVADGDIPVIFPNIVNFTPRYLDFLP